MCTSWSCVFSALASSGNCSLSTLNTASLTRLGELTALDGSFALRGRVVVVAHAAKLIATTERMTRTIRIRAPVDDYIRISGSNARLESRAHPGRAGPASDPVGRAFRRAARR